MYLRPNQDACADEYGEVEHTKLNMQIKQKQ